MKEFAGKVAGITGAANGIGKAFAEEAARRGMNLALIDIETENLETVKKECEALGAPKVVAITTDVTDAEQVRFSVQRIMNEFGKINVFLNNAGVAGAGWVDKIPPQDWEWIMASVFFGHAYNVPVVQAYIASEPFVCHFLFTASIAGLHPGFRYQSAYMAAKHASLCLAESVRNYADNVMPHIGVSVFCPEYVCTAIHDSEKRRVKKFTKPGDPFYATDNYLDYIAQFRSNILNKGANPRFVGPRLFRAMEDNQMYVVPHMHTHDKIVERHRMIEADLEKDKQIDAEFNAELMGWDD